ncbi:DHH family phosphoesterase [Bacillus velezensis]|nr:DHH family phosphoesterase [Bacillus velezensis]WEV83631.1 DHH family phosphoesterase [Bacillus velezensis]
MRNIKKVKLFTHTDLDGVGCAIVCNHLLNDVEVEFCDYHNIDQKVLEFINNNRFKEYDLILVTDISVNKDLAEKINEIQSTSKWVLIDHHATAKWLNIYKWANVNDYYIKSPCEENLKTSATSMVYDHLIKFQNNECEELSEFVEKVRRYDTWEWSTKYNDTHAKKLNDLLYIIGRENFIKRFSTNPSIYFSDHELHILDIEKFKIKEYISKKEKQLRTLQVLDYSTGVVFADTYQSELGNELAQKNPNLDFIIIIDPGSLKVSYRGVKEKIDLGKDIVAKFGGGGHPRATGSQINQRVIDSVLKLILN